MQNEQDLIESINSLSKDISGLVENLSSEEDENIKTINDLIDYFEEQKEIDSENSQVFDEDLKESLITIHQTTNDNTEQLLLINDNLTNVNNSLVGINDKLNELSYGTNTILTYGIYYIPLAVIIFLLWRFFATFIKTY